MKLLGYNPTSVVAWFAFAFAVCTLLVFGMWSLDNKPPFEMTGFSIDSKARAGGFVRITMQVKRDITRHCNVQLSRFVQNASGYRTYSDSQVLSFNDIERLEQITPGETKVVVPISQAAVPGPAVVGTAIQYECNPLHRFFPIYTATAIPIVIE